MNRRQVLQAGALLGAAGALGGCEKLISAVATRLEDLPDSFGQAGGEQIDPAFHLLSRAAYGPRPGDLERVRRIGLAAWVDEQLAPEQIGDLACDLRARRFESIHQSPGTCYEYKRPVLRREITRHTLLRAVYSQRQLYEVLVGFWTDHLNIDLDKGDCIYLKPTDDREVVRRHALGRFRELVRASATSPAMLVYLDGADNKQRKPEDAPNENYARELMELHTMGVDGGYTQQDVREAARCLTGWRVRKKWRRGTVWFDPRRHDDGRKLVLGQVIPAGGGARDTDRLVEIVCAHPSTARHIARKLVRRFVGYDAPQRLVDDVARTFRATGGQIKPLLRQILLSPEFAAARGTKIKRPFRFVASALRALGAETHAPRPVLEYLQRMGQQPFSYPTPDGYPDEGPAWLGTLLWRWNFALELAGGRIGGVRLPRRRRIEQTQPAALAAYLLGRQAGAAELAALSTREGIGLLLASPAFQRC